MTPLNQRIEIAKACGWNVEPKQLGGIFIYEDALGNIHGALPNYIKDLNAMHEAEKTLPIKLHWAYQDALWHVYKPSMDLEKGLLGYLCATSAQRAEAFLRTIKKWVEEPATPAGSLSHSPDARPPETARWLGCPAGSF